MPVPHAEEGKICPLHKKDMVEVCHTCPWWTHIRGTNPNTGAELDNWSCAVAWLPLMMIEAANQSRQAGASVDKLSNLISDGMGEVAARLETSGKLIDAPHDR